MTFLLKEWSATSAWTELGLLCFCNPSMGLLVRSSCAAPYLAPLFFTLQESSIGISRSRGDALKTNALHFSTGASLEPDQRLQADCGRLFQSFKKVLQGQPFGAHSVDRPAVIRTYGSVWSTCNLGWIGGIGHDRPMASGYGSGCAF